MSRQMMNTLFVTHQGVCEAGRRYGARGRKGEKLLQVPLLGLEAPGLLRGRFAFAAANDAGVPGTDREVTFLDSPAGSSAGWSARSRATSCSARRSTRRRPMRAAASRSPGRSSRARSRTRGRRCCGRRQGDAGGRRALATLNEQSAYIAAHLQTLPDTMTLDNIRGVGGAGRLLLFRRVRRDDRPARSRNSLHYAHARPPSDRMNALLSFVYRCSPTTARRRWREWDWTRSSAISTACAQAVPRSRWTWWRSFARTSRIDWCSR